VLHQYTDVEKLTSIITVKIHVLSDTRLDAEASVYIDGKFQFHSKFVVGDKTNSEKEKIRNKNIKTIEGTLVTLGVINISNATLWWPLGYGDQHLYEVDVHYSSPMDMDYYDPNASPLFHSLKRKIGLRTVELIQELVVDKYEPVITEINNVQPTTFYFRINGKSIFIKGANFIPIDAFQSRITPEDREYLLRVAVESNMNMIRVWGGGIYQPDDFYDKADQLGIMIWQEFMFACALYPRDKLFLDSVALEVEQQVMRLSSHSSIIIWGGNNENEAALDWFQESRERRDMYVVDYNKFFIDTVLLTLRNIDGNERGLQRVFVDSSPSNGAFPPSSLDPGMYIKKWGPTGTPTAGSYFLHAYT
jgi:beta-mannosidase